MQLQRYHADTASTREDSYRSGRPSTQPLELMQNSEASKSGTEGKRGSIRTIDDLWRKAEELSAGLKRLSQSKHSLAIRRGVRRGVRRELRDNDNSIQIKAAGRPIFLISSRQEKVKAIYDSLKAAKVRGTSGNAIASTCFQRTQRNSPGLSPRWLTASSLQ
jgi:hypothetical protein